MKIIKRIQEETTPDPGRAAFGIGKRSADEPLPADNIAPTPAEAKVPEQSDPYLVVSEQLLKLVGEKVLSEIQQNPGFQVPYLDSTVEPVEWLEAALKTLLSFEGAEQLQQRFLEHVTGPSHQIELLTIQLNDLQRQLNEAKNQVLERDARLSEAEKTNNRYQQQLRGRAELGKVIDLCFDRRNADEATLNTLLREDLSSPTDALAPFVLALGEAWMRLRDDTLRQLSDDESQNLERLHAGLTQLLGAISGLFVTCRRVVLDKLAYICSLPLPTYQFISPEETLQVNLAIHSADGLGSSNIREGISFAILRRDNRQTIRYADVKVI